MTVRTGELCGSELRFFPDERAGIPKRIQCRQTCSVAAGRAAQQPAMRLLGFLGSRSADEAYKNAAILFLRPLTTPGGHHFVPYRGIARIGLQLTTWGPVGRNRNRWTIGVRRSIKLKGEAT
jgi:hypothetical protein